MLKEGICVPNNEDLKKEILPEAYTTPYSLYPGTTKMYKDLKKHYLLHGMKKDIVKFVAQYFTCQQIKAKHQKLAGLLQNPIKFPNENGKKS